MKQSTIPTIKPTFDAAAEATGMAIQVQRKKDSTQWRVFLQGELFGDYRISKMLGFCDGWRVASACYGQLTYKGLHEDTATWIVMSRCFTSSLLNAGNPVHGLNRGFIALKNQAENCIIMPFFEDLPSPVLEEFHKRIEQKISLICCEFWDTVTLNKKVAEGMKP